MKRLAVVVMLFHMLGCSAPSKPIQQVPVIGGVIQGTAAVK